MRCGFWPLVQLKFYPWSSHSFPSERSAGVSSRSFTVPNKPNSLTYTVASSFVCTSPFAVLAVFGPLDVFMVSNSEEWLSRLLIISDFYRLLRFPTRQSSGLSGWPCACSRQNLQQTLSSGFHNEYGQQDPLIGLRKESSFVRFFELQDVLGQSPRVSAGTSLLSFNLLLRSILKFHSVECADEEFWLIFRATNLCFLGCLHDVAWLL